MPNLYPRRAIFLNYHDSKIPLQAEDVEYNRYHPLVLNAAFLGNLDAEDYRILGFGDKTNYVPAFQRKAKHTAFQSVVKKSYEIKLSTDRFSQRVSGRLARILGKK
jgi:hypothetical protein